MMECDAESSQLGQNKESLERARAIRGESGKHGKVLKVESQSGHGRQDGRLSNKNLMLQLSSR
jgi:hypothetical protein